MKSNNQGSHSFHKRANPNPPIRVLDKPRLSEKKPSQTVEITCGLCQHRFERPTKPASLVLICPACGVRFQNSLDGKELVDSGQWAVGSIRTKSEKERSALTEESVPDNQRFVIRKKPENVRNRKLPTPHGPLPTAPPRSLWKVFCQSTFGAVLITLAQSLLIVAVLIGLINGTSLIFWENSSSHGKKLSRTTPPRPLKGIATEDNFFDFADSPPILQENLKENLKVVELREPPSAQPLPLVSKTTDVADTPLPMFSPTVELPLFVAQKDSRPKSARTREYVDFVDFNDSVVKDKEISTPLLAKSPEDFSELQRELKSKLDETEKKVKELEQRYEKSLIQKDQIQHQSKRLVSETLLRESAISLEKNPPRSLILSLKSIRMLYELGEQVSDLGKQVLAHAYAVQSPGVSFINQVPLVLAHSVSSNGNWLLTANADQSLWIWDISKTGGKKTSEVGFKIDKTSVPLLQLLLTPDEHWVVGARSDGFVEMWNMSFEQPSEATILLKEHIPGLNRIEITPNGKWLLAYTTEPGTTTSTSTSPDETKGVWLWNLELLKQNKQGATVPQAIVLRGDNQPVQCLSVSPDSRWLATGNTDRNIRVYDLKSAYPGANQKILRGHQLEVTAIQFSANGRWIATGSRDNTVRIWDLNEHVPNPNSYVLNAHNGWISSLALSADGKWFATAGYDQTVRIWNMRSILDKTNEKPLVSLAPEQGVVRKVEFSPDSSAFVTYGANKSVKLWNMKLNSESTLDRPIRLGEEISSYSFGEKGRWLVLAWNQGNHTNVSLWPMRVDDLVRQASHFAETDLPVEVHRQEEIYANQFESRLVR